MTEGDQYNVDTIQIMRIPKEVTKSELLNWFKEAANMEVLEDQIKEDRVAGRWFLTGVGLLNMTSVIGALQGKKIKNSSIYARAFRPITPEKKGEECII